MKITPPLGVSLRGAPRRPGGTADLDSCSLIETLVGYLCMTTTTAQAWANIAFTNQITAVRSSELSARIILRQNVLVDRPFAQAS